MLFFSAFMAPALALAPVEASAPIDASAVVLGLAEESEGVSAASVGVQRGASPGWVAWEAWRSRREAHQVRIRQEIMIRVSPRRRDSRELVADWRRTLPRRYEQRKIGKCLAAKDVVAVQTVSARDLVLYLSDRRMIRARLQKSCNARDFYLGFYMEPNEDGEMCADRDTLRARNGATCKIGAIRQLVPAEGPAD